MIILSLPIAFLFTSLANVLVARVSRTRAGVTPVSMATGLYLAALSAFGGVAVSFASSVLVGVPVGYSVIVAVACSMALNLYFMLRRTDFVDLWVPNVLVATTFIVGVVANVAAAFLYGGFTVATVATMIAAFALPCVLLFRYFHTGGAFGAGDVKATWAAATCAVAGANLFGLLFGVLFSAVAYLWIRRVAPRKWPDRSGVPIAPALVSGYVAAIVLAAPVTIAVVWVVTFLGSMFTGGAM